MPNIKPVVQLHMKHRHSAATGGSRPRQGFSANNGRAEWKVREAEAILCNAAGGKGTAPLRFA